MRVEHRLRSHHETHGLPGTEFRLLWHLIDWEAGIGSVVRAWADRQGVALSTEELLVAYADNRSGRRTAPPDRPVSVDTLARALRGLGKTLGSEVSDDDAHLLATSVPDWPAFPDSQQALERLAQHFALIIVSNVDNRGFAASNEKLGVTFDAILTAEHRLLQAIATQLPTPSIVEWTRWRHPAREGFCTLAKACSTITSQRNPRHDYCVDQPSPR